MNPNITLRKWADACDRTGIRWFLFKETLLCANGYHTLPAEISHAQIAVLAKDLPDLVEYVFPALPQKWTLSKSWASGSNRELEFQVKQKTVLAITVLYGVENEADMIDLNDRIKQTVSKNKRRIKRNQRAYKRFRKLLGGLYTRTFGKLNRRRVRKLTAKTFRALLDLAGTSNEDCPFYCDSLTNKKPHLLAKELFEEILTITCTPNQEDIPPQEDLPVQEDMDIPLDDPEIEDTEVSPKILPDQVQYPVFSGYREYLFDVYGDYENGLTDEIGCGLTVEEKEALKQHQARCFEALTFLQKLSKEFGLRYYLIAGSVLGAVRHGGFIPWDDDIDIGIRIEEIEEFEQAVKEHLPSRLPEGFTLEQSGADNPYPRMFSKICYEGRCCIDLWPLVPTYRDGFHARFLWYFGKIITKIHYQKIGHKVTKFLRIVKPASALLSDKTIMDLARRNERRYAGKQTPAYINLYSIYRRHKETFKREWLDDEATAMFNGLEVPVVGHTKLYLTHLYGNYMAFPAPWKRVSRHVARFSNESESDQQ